MNYNIVPLMAQDQKEIIRILLKNNLPTGDIQQNHLIKFFGIKIENEIIGLIGLELFHHVALLRSLVIDSKYRNKGMARQLVSHLENYSKNVGTKYVYLLTTTAKNYFESLSYKTIERKLAPAQIKNTIEFSHLCSDNATFMRKKLKAD